MFLTKKITLPRVNHEWYENPANQVWTLAYSEFCDLEKIFKAGKGELSINLRLCLLTLCVGEVYGMTPDRGPFLEDDTYNRMIAAIFMAIPEWATVANIADFMGTDEDDVQRCINKFATKPEHELRVAVTRYRVIRALLDSDLDGIWDEPEKYATGLYDEFDDDFDSAKFVSL
jgi:hypothetical protein